jgi:hypothetical protein
VEAVSFSSIERATRIQESVYIDSVALDLASILLITGKGWGQENSKNYYTVVFDVNGLIPFPLRGVG